MTTAECEAQIDRLCRAHADAHRNGDHELARALLRAMARHTARLTEPAPAEQPTLHIDKATP